MAALVDTNILVYRYDFRYPVRQRIAERFLRSGLELQMLRLPHQAIIEFVSVVTRPLPGGGSLLSRHEAYREAEEMLNQFVILYPTEEVVRIAASRPISSPGSMRTSGPMPSSTVCRN